MKLPALNQLPVPVFLCSEDGTLTFVNTAWTDLLGTVPGDPWHTPFTDLTPEELDNLWRECVEDQQPCRLSSRAQPNPASTLWFELLLQPALDDAGTPVLLGSLTDVTARVEAVAETNAILQTAVDAVIIIDEHGRIENFNRAACTMFGYTEADTIGQQITMLMGEPFRSGHQHYVDSYLATGHASIIGIGRELEARHASGRMFPIYLAVSEIQVAGRRRFTGIIRDLSEQHASRKALEEQREKLAHVGRLSIMGEMTASIAHEINQPLTAISMYAQAGLKLLDREGGTEKLRSALEKLNVQALRAGAVIERIQRFARAQESIRQFININELIRDLLNLAESDARMHDIELALETEPGLDDLYADPIQLQQVILNLIRNAIDAMMEVGCRHGRRIVISSRRTAAQEIEVAVEDLGSGVAEDQQDLLFTPFHTTKKEGMGMGLSICRSIIKEHGGELNYRSNQGPGATFFFRLPIQQDD